MQESGFLMMWLPYDDDACDIDAMVDLRFGSAHTLTFKGDSKPCVLLLSRLYCHYCVFAIHHTHL